MHDGDVLADAHAGVGVEDGSPLLAPGELHAPDGVVTLPLWDRWPASALARIRDRGLRAFQRSHGQRPIADDEAVFADVVDGCLDRSLALGSFPDVQHAGIPRPKWSIVAGIDPSASGFWVLVVLGVEQRSGHRAVLWMERARGAEIDEHTAIIRHIYARHRWRACNLERNATQALLRAQYVKAGAPISLSQTTADMHFQLGMISDEMAARKWHIPAVARLQPLIEELKSYPTGKTDDCVQALRLAWLLADVVKPGSGCRIDSVWV